MTPARRVLIQFLTENRVAASVSRPQRRKPTLTSCRLMQANHATVVAIKDGYTTPTAIEPVGNVLWVCDAKAVIRVRSRLMPWHWRTRVCPISGSAHRVHRNRAIRFRGNSDGDRYHSSPRAAQPGSQ
jgi:hypothetical protein